MTNSFAFDLNSNIDFSFNLYENVPIGEHSATIKNIIIDKNKPTKYGMKERYTIIFYLNDIEREFNYYFDKSFSENSKYHSFFKMICSALGTTNINGNELIGQNFLITISLVPHFADSDKMITKVTNIRKDDINIGKCS